jgi:hypothetical protein
LPVLYVFGRKKIDFDIFVNSVKSEFSPHQDKVLVFYDPSYHYIIPDLETRLKQVENYENFIFTRLQKEVERTKVEGKGEEVSGTCCGGSNACSSTNTEGGKESSNNNTSCANGNSCCGNGTCTPNSTHNNDNAVSDSTNNLTINVDNNNARQDLNGRTFLLIPGTSLQDYTFFCILTSRPPPPPPQNLSKQNDCL